MYRCVALASVATLLALTACTGGNNKSNPPSTRGAADAATTVATVAAGRSSAPAPQQSTTAAPASGVAAVEDRLLKAALSQADLPQVSLNAKRPFNNHDAAMGQTDPAAFEKMLNDDGRISGALVQFLPVASPPAGSAALLGVLEILSTWRSDDGAHTGLAETLNTVSLLGAQPNTVTTDSEPADLGQIGDEVSGKHVHVTSLAQGQPAADVYIVGLRRGRDTAVIVFSGAGGGPTLDQVKQLVQTQNQRFG